MRGRWCDMMAAAAAGDVPNVCDGYATEKVVYTWPGLGTCVGFYCESCAREAAYRAAEPESFSCGVCGSNLGQVAACDMCGPVAS
jgi:hypothetical protein